MNEESVNLIVSPIGDYLVKEAPSLVHQATRWQALMHLHSSLKVNILSYDLERLELSNELTHAHGK